MEPTRRRDSGKWPECGAIFMSNTKTRRECFSRLLFALPRANLEFVRKVRKRMVLFLFDYQEKKLYGVFEADSDGGLNMVPDAYTSSGKSFPAQVRIRIVWNCYPLHEHEFCDAISDNYYEKYKFNFGLSVDQVKRLIHLFESKRVDIKKSPNEVKIKNIYSEHSGRKIKHTSSDHSGGKKTPHSETQSVQVLKDEKSVDISSSVALELGDFIPLFSPEHCDPTEITATDDQSSPYYSMEQENPRVKGLYSDRIEQKESVFDRLELSSKCTTDFDMGSKRKRSYADVETMKVNKRSLWQSREIQKWINYAPNREDTPKKASVFSRLKFNSESNNRETHISKEKERRDHRGVRKCYGHVEKNYSTDPVEMFDNRWGAEDNAKGIPFRKGMQEEKSFMNVKPEGNSDGDLGDRRHNHSPVSGFLTDMPQTKRKLGTPILSAEPGDAHVWGSNLDDQMQTCENSIVETKSVSLQLTLNDMPFITDPMKYLVHVRDLNQDQEKGAEKELLPSLGASDDLNQDQEKGAEKELLPSLGASDDLNQDQEKCAGKELLPSLGASDDLNQDDLNQGQEKCAGKELLPSLGASDDLNQGQEKCAEKVFLQSLGASDDLNPGQEKCAEKELLPSLVASDNLNQDQEKCAGKELLLSFGASDDLNQDQEKCAQEELLPSFGASDDLNQDQEKELLSSFGASEMVNMVDNPKRYLENLETTTCLVADHENSDVEVINTGDKLDNSSGLNSVEKPHAIYKQQHCLPVEPVVRDQNQDQEKCAEKGLLLSFGASEIVDTKRCLENLETTTCLVADHKNSDVEVINTEDNLDNSSSLKSFEKPDAIYKQHCLPVAPPVARDQNEDQEKCAEKDLLPSFGACEMVDMFDNHKRYLENLETTTCLVADHESSNVEVINIEDKLEKPCDIIHPNKNSDIC